MYKRHKHILSERIYELQRVHAKMFNIFAVMETQIKTTMKYHYPPIKIVSKFKKKTVMIQNVGEDAQELDHSYFTGSNIKWYQPL